MPTINTGAVTLAYEDAGSGAPVVLVHGWTLDRRMWDELAADLLATGFRVLRYDLRGHGESEAPAAGYAAEHHAADLAGLIDALGLAPAHVVGLSLGGSIAAALAEAQPERVRSLVLLAANLPGLPFGPEFSAVLARMRERARAGDLAGALFEDWLDTPLFAPTNADPRQWARLAAMLDRHSGASFFDDSLPSEGPTILERLPEVQAPALVLVGDRDLLDFQLAGESYAGLLPHARLEQVPDAGHMLNMDQPAAVNRLIVDFLIQVDAQA